MFAMQKIIPGFTVSNPVDRKKGNVTDMAKKNTYDAGSISVLEGLEAVRKRPGMYIGSVSRKGLNHLIYEIVDNAVDEHLAGYCSLIHVILEKDGSCTVTDNGRGIPVDMHEKGVSAERLVFTTLHAGGKFDNSAYKTSGGLHGVGSSVVNALSTYLDIKISRDGYVHHDHYERGIPTIELEEGLLPKLGKTRQTGTSINFLPDPEIFEKTRMFAQIKDYFIYRLTGEYYTDHSTASDHGFFDITNRCYWNEMLEFTGIKEEYLPKLVEPGTELGTISREAALEFGLNPETKINVGAFDQGCGAIGAGNTKPGIASESTGSALVTVATIDALNPDSQGDVPTLCSGIPGKYMYQPYCTGSIIMKWYRDIFCEAEKMVEEQTGLNAYTQMDEMVKATPAGADGLIMLPYFQGSGIPELNEKAEGVYYGINAGHTRGHFIRAIMEGLAIALKRMLECEEKLGATMTEIRSLGGGSKSKAWCQIKADILDMPVKVINNSESTPCMGCAILAGVANGMWNSIDEATEKFVTIKEIYYPNPDNKEIYKNVYNKYVEVTKALNPTFK